MNSNKFCVERIIWQDKLLTLSDKLVYTALAFFSVDGETSYPSIGELIEFTELARRTVFYSLNKLEQRSYISKKSNAGKISIYNLISVSAPVQESSALHPSNAPVQDNIDVEASVEANMSSASDGMNARVQEGSVDSAGKEKESNKEKETSKLNNNIYISEKIEKKALISSINYLRSVPESDMLEFETKFGLSREVILHESEVAIDYVKSRGKKLVDYQSFLRNWLRKAAKWRNGEQTVKALQPLTPLRLWEIAKEEDIDLEHVKEVHKNILMKIKDGNKYNISNIEKTLHKWLQEGVVNGKYQHMNEFERMFLENNHPEKVVDFDNWAADLREQNLI